MKRVVFMGRKPAACRCLEYLVEKGVTVVVVVTNLENSYDFRRERLVDVAKYHGIPVVNDSDIYAYLKMGTLVPEWGFDLRAIDVVFSVLYGRLIKQPLLNLPSLGCINFHPAPLPKYRGVGGYNLCIYENRTDWGVTAHYVDEGIDTGDIIKVQRFDIDPKLETAYSLEQTTQVFLHNLFKEIAEALCAGQPLPRALQGRGHCTTWDDFKALQKIDSEDTLEEVNRKIRAFWYPPYDGATIGVRGKQFTLVDKDILREIGKKYNYPR